MNILVIGNGFDLAHGLPTRYYDFIKFVKLLQEIDGKNRRERVQIIKDANKYKTQESKIDEDILEKLLDNSIYEEDCFHELMSCIKENGWIEYFKDKVKSQSTWVDFEMNIKELIKIFDNIINQDEGSLEKLKINPIRVLRVIGNFCNDKKNFEARDMAGMTVRWLKKFITKDLIEVLERDLKKLIRALEIYLYLFVESIKSDITPGVVENIDKVITFNYTNTYLRLYDKDRNVEYDYIHGKVDINSSIEKNNMVLGIDEYLEDGRKDKDLEFIFFKKYFQRIYKRTGCRYKQWLDDIRDYNEENNIYFYGHSLSRADKDILEDLILCENVKVTIYYHNDEAYRSQITNLVDVIGQDKLIKKVYGNDPEIIFESTEDKQQLEIIASRCENGNYIGVYQY